MHGPGNRVRAVGRAVPVWGWPAGITLLTNLIGIGQAQPWRDELATWSAATRPVGDLVRMAGTIDAVTAPYYLLMHGWLAGAGNSPTALRLPSALAVAGAAGLTAALGDRLFGPRAGLLAGLLFAALPGTSRYGQEARPYALAALLAVLATLQLVAALYRPAPSRWAAYAATVAALGLTHLLALGLLAGHGVAVLVARRQPTTATWRREAVRWLLTLLPAAALVTPLALLARTQHSRQLDWVDRARLADLAALPGGLTQSGVVGGLLVGLAALGAARGGRRAVLPAACLLAPVLLLFVAGRYVPLWVPRYLALTVPFACLLAGAALAGVRLPAGLAVVALAGLLGLPDQAGIRRTHDWPRTAQVDYRGAARIIENGQQASDGVVWSPRDGPLLLDVGTAYHLGSRRPRDVLVVRDQRQRADLWADECDQPAGCLAGVERVWLVVAGRHDDPPAAVPGAKGAALRDGYAVRQVWHRPGLTIALLSR
ncbi:glycosyltransferase family 39 protein [Micromonospora siamensis]|uniref:glycosyltransferase family 39 protein n=1 Tax=Micromonospora siamensis TaxID=299152 RepID=UPI000B5B0206|nr:glycosyltransferase family 39 protein [Micromonospora siamensis]